MNIRNAEMDMNVTWIDINGNKKHLTSREHCKIPVSFWSWNHDKKWINVSKNLSKKLWNPFLTLQKLFSRKANSSWITAKSCFAKGPCCKSYKAAQIQGPWGHSYSKMRVYLLTWRSRRQMLMFGSCKKLCEMANLYLECVNIISMALRWCALEEISE